MSTPTDSTRPFARPAFPVLQQNSTNSSTFQSYSSTTSLASQSPASAPLPSPSGTRHEQQGFFGSLNQQPTQQQAQQGQQQQQQQQAQNVQSPSAYTYQPNRHGAGQTAAETNNYLNQAALLAEAAKRAQMAVLMRDIDGMEL